MSSIDKYVANEARKYDPSVKVSKIAGRIIGKIDGRVVFNIADRYGYLNASEEAKIREGIEGYKRDEESMRLMLEQERLNAKSRAESAFKRKQRDAGDALSSVFERGGAPALVFNPSMFEGFNAAKLRRKVDEVNGEYSSAVARARSAAEANLEKINGLGKEITPSLTTAEYIDIERRLNSVDIERGDFSRIAVRRAEVEQEMRILSEALNRVRSAIGGINLRAIPAELRDIIGSMISEIRAFEVSSLSDIDKMLERINSTVELVNGKIAELKDAALIAEARRLEGQLLACREIKSFVEENSYETVSFEVEIEESGKLLADTVDELTDAPYTTADEYVLVEMRRLADEAISCKDELTLKKLRRSLEELNSVKEKDRVIESDYAEYEERTSDLRARGVDVSDEVFDAESFARGDRTQISRLIQKQIDAGIREAANNASINMAMADEAMTELGYELVKVDDSDELAPEAYYAKPGMAGVLCKVSAEASVIGMDGEERLVWGVRRTLVGITDGDEITSVDTIKRAAMEMEVTGEVAEFLNKIAEKGDGTAIIGEDYVDAESEYSDEAIAENGALMLEGTVTVEAEDGTATEMSLKDRIASVIGEVSADVAVTEKVSDGEKKDEREESFKLKRRVINVGEEKKSGNRARAAVRNRYKAKKG